jgi:hypothetical protein
MSNHQVEMVGPGGKRYVTDTPQEIELYRSQGYKFVDAKREEEYLKAKAK